MAVALYSPQDVIISLAGMHTISGYADGTFVRITKDMKPFSKVRAMDGEMARMYNEDEGFRVEVTIAQSSTSNNILTSIYNVDTATHMGKFPMFIKDTKGQTNFFAATAWIEMIPDVTFSNQLETRTWTFGCSGAILTIGGNNDTSLLEDTLLLGSSGLLVLKQFGVL
jgi:hypothetical protein